MVLFSHILKAYLKGGIYVLNLTFISIVVVAIVVGLLTGNVAELSNAILNEGNTAVEFAIYLSGSMAVWGGLMRVAESSGITEYICTMFTPLLSRVFRGLDTNSKSFKSICMNLTANMLGFGNSATPYGIQAVKYLEQEECHGYASDNFILFCVMNTSSLTLIPSTVASIRSMHGSANPMAILPAVLVASLIDITLVVAFTKLLNKLNRR
jgi:spore maturation protein A